MRCEDWGEVEYEAATARQLALVDRVAAGQDEDVIVMCTHPPVVTLGRGSVATDLDGWSGRLIESSRGGRATYHGPSQLVIYPVIDLRRPRGDQKPRDVHAYLRTLEGATVDALNALGLGDVEARTTVAGELSLTGVWVGARKIASIGIAVRRWVTYHGVAVNVFDDAAAFRGIRPCGFSADIMTNAERELGRAIDPAACRDVFADVFTARFSP